jgi:tetratricopeptide (TPR) repeat protein
MVKEAIEIFKLNVEAYPESGNVYDSLAEAYMNDGNEELAIKFYLESLEKDPSNDNARGMLKRLGYKKD